jgi:hypothetical protein
VRWFYPKKCRIQQSNAVLPEASSLR